MTAPTPLTSERGNKTNTAIERTLQMNDEINIAIQTFTVSPFSLYLLSQC